MIHGLHGAEARLEDVAAVLRVLAVGHASLVSEVSELVSKVSKQVSHVSQGVKEAATAVHAWQPVGNPDLSQSGTECPIAGEGWGAKV